MGDVMVWIRFTQDYQVQAPGGAAYTAGQEVEVSRATADHFLARRAAVEMDRPKPKPKKKPDGPRKPDSDDGGDDQTADRH